MDTTCACGSSDETIDHMLHECALINQERQFNISSSKDRIWPIDKHLIFKHYQSFVKCINKISFDKYKIINSLTTLMYSTS